MSDSQKKTKKGWEGRGGGEAGGGRFGMLALDPGTQQLLGFGTECEVLGLREGDEGDEGAPRGGSPLS